MTVSPPSYLQQRVYEYHRQKNDPLVTAYPDEFIEQFILDDATGGLISLVDEQRIALRAMFARDSQGYLKYDTIIYSAPKKSGKTAIGGGVALWQACRVPGDVYVIGNDLQQADNRMAQFMRYTLEHHPQFRAYARLVRYTTHLQNGSIIRAIPVDPEGEAGMNPSALFWTEAWGARHDKHERLWTEAALSPQRAGNSFKFVEGYAGYKNEGNFYERLYQTVWQAGEAFPLDELKRICDDLQHDYPKFKRPTDDDLKTFSDELRTRGSAIVWWCQRRLLPAQQGEMGKRYYAGEALRLVEQEYRRQHHNEWVETDQAFIPIQWWDACEGTPPALGEYELQVLALDAAVSNDCFAAVSVSRRGDLVIERSVQVWEPPIDFSDVEQWIIDYGKNNKVAVITYDPYQLADMAQRLELAGFWMEAFNQGAKRLTADKALHDRIRERRYLHSGNAIARKHVQNAAAKIDREDGKLRIIKSSDNAKVDAVVALSMACHVASDLDIG